jgi:hypothetical protein
MPDPQKRPSRSGSEVRIRQIDQPDSIQVSAYPEIERREADFRPLLSKTGQARGAVC